MDSCWYLFLPPLRKFGQEPYERLGIKSYLILMETKLIIQTKAQE